MKLFKSPNIKQELLKLNSLFNSRRGKRKGNQNSKEFDNPSKALPDALLDYLNSIEILNRQSLPLRSN
jgi:hypothetical protein